MTKRKVTKATKRRLGVFGLISLFCILYFLFTLCYELYQIYDLNTKKHNLEVEYKELKKEAENLEIELSELNNPEYLAKYAREHYSYSKDGEYIIKLQETDKKIKKVNNKLNTDYIFIGISLFGFILLLLFFKSIHKKSKS